MSGPTTRGDRRELEQYLAKLEVIGEGPILFDLAGPAVYQLEPLWRSVVLCLACQFIDLMLTIPARSLVWRCPRCNTPAWLVPPPDVLNAQPPADATRLRRALS